MFSFLDKRFTDSYHGTLQTLMTATTPDWIVGSGGQFISNATSSNDCHVKGQGDLYEVSGNLMIISGNSQQSIASFESLGESDLDMAIFPNPVHGTAH